MSRTDADVRELARAVERVRRADLDARRAVGTLAETSRRGAIATTAAVSLGLAAVAALASASRRPRTPQPVPRRAGLVAAIVPFALDYAIRQLAGRWGGTQSPASTAAVALKSHAVPAASGRKTPSPIN